MKSWRDEICQAGVFRRCDTVFPDTGGPTGRRRPGRPGGSDRSNVLLHRVFSSRYNREPGFDDHMTRFLKKIGVVGRRAGSTDLRPKSAQRGVAGSGWHLGRLREKLATRGQYGADVGIFLRRRALAQGFAGRGPDREMANRGKRGKIERRIFRHSGIFRAAKICKEKAARVCGLKA